MNKKGQFSIIAALLVAVILIATVIITYSTIRDNQVQNQPSILTAIDETNLAVKQVLGFTVGYYGSILQVTGNQSYAKTLAMNYLQSGLLNIASMNPEWGTSLNVNSSQLYTYWYTNSSFSMGNLTVNYNLTGLGISGVTYQTSCKLSVNATNGGTNQARLDVTQSDNEPLVNLGTQNFKFYRYSSSNSTWLKIAPTNEPLSYANGTYVMDTPPGVDPYSFLVQVEDPRGLIVVASSFSRLVYDLNFTGWNATALAQDATFTVELLQDGTMRWLGQNLQMTTQAKPFPPIPIKAIHVNQTSGGVNVEVPFQVEDWASGYTIPLGLTSNASVFSDRNMLVFLANPRLTEVTVWWNGSDVATQIPYAYTNRYFNDSPTANTLSNGLLKLQLINPGSFTFKSTVGGSSVTTDFMRVNQQWSSYGSDFPAYVVYNGTVRDIIRQEPEWGGGVSGCPDFYGYIVLTLPANATYYTYQLSLIFLNTQKSRAITDLLLVRLTGLTGQSQVENGITGGYPIVSNATGLYYNASSVWQHHWSQFVQGTRGAGIMFTDDSNQKLYTFDSIAGNKTGALSADASNRAIGLMPVTTAAQAKFNNSMNVIWYGAVVTFDGTTPIYNNSDKTGLWMLVERPPIMNVSTES
jgi:hypothetical protein